jgi:hypothetical protein
MFGPNNGERLYSSALDYVKTAYYGQVGPNFGGEGDQTNPGSPTTVMNSLPNDNVGKEEIQRENYLAQRFPNFVKQGAGKIENVAKWTT